MTDASLNAGAGSDPTSGPIPGTLPGVQLAASGAPPPGPDNLSVDLSGERTKQAGKFVTIFVAVIAFVVLLVAGLQLVLLENKVQLPKDSTDLMTICLNAKCSPEQFRLMMEQDAQNHRTDRVRRSLNNRMLIFIVAEIVALCLVAIGGVLIFDRIEASKVQEVRTQWFTVVTTFPGVLLTVMGTFVLAWALHLATQPDSRITVWDFPVFVQDQNTYRNMVGARSGHSPGVVVTTGEGPDPEASSVFDGIDVNPTDLGDPQ